jgi:diamine N-acetyltransferase
MIKGKNISLRAMEFSDAELLYEWENDMEIWHFSNTLTPFSRFTLEQYVMNSHQDIFTNKQIRMMIDLEKDGQKGLTIGSVDLFDFEPMHRRAGVGILLLKDFRGKGHASEAIDLLIRYSSKTLNLHQLFCNIGTSNQESLNLFLGKNFTIAGTKKDWNYINKRWEDEVLLQLILEKD